MSVINFSKRGISFMPEMILAIRKNWKTKTSRKQRLEEINKEPDKWNLDKICKQDDGVFAHFSSKINPDTVKVIKCNIGKPGDVLWVKEEHYMYGHWEEDNTSKRKSDRQSWRFIADSHEVRYCDNKPEALKSRSINQPYKSTWYKRLARFMPKQCSRMSIEITDVSVTRIKDISVDYALKEGIYRWNSIDEYLDELKEYEVENDTKILTNSIVEKLKKTWPDDGNGTLYRLYISPFLIVPLQFSITSSAVESFVSLYLSVNDENDMNLASEKNNPWVFSIDFKILNY